MKTQPSFNSRELTLSTVLYRYIWPFWMFENVMVGSLFERAAAFRRNQSQRFFLPTYMMRWSVLILISMQMIAVFQTSNPANYLCLILSTTSGLLTAWAAVVEFMIVTTYLCLTHWES